MQPAPYFYRWSSMVCLSVCYNLQPSKNGWTDWDAIWGVDSSWPKEPRIRRRSRSLCEGANFEGVSAWQMAGWRSKINNSSTTGTKLWRNAGPSAFQLQRLCWKVTNYNVYISWLTVPVYEHFEQPRSTTGSKTLLKQNVPFFIRGAG